MLELVHEALDEQEVARPALRLVVGFDAGGPYKRALAQMLRARDGDACYLCRVDLNTVRIAIEHIIPTSRGGTDEASNLALACFRCNSKKGDQFVSFSIRSRSPIYWR